MTWADVAWEESGPESDPAARLTGNPPHRPTFGCALHICNVPMHVEAYAVVDVDGVQANGARSDEAGEWVESALRAISTIDEGGDPRCTFTRAGREYVIVAFPFGA